MRPVLGEARYGNVVLPCGVGKRVATRGLPGGAEGIRTPDLCSAIAGLSQPPDVERPTNLALCSDAGQTSKASGRGAIGTILSGGGVEYVSTRWPHNGHAGQCRGLKWASQGCLTCVLSSILTMHHC